MKRGLFVVSGLGVVVALFSAACSEASPVSGDGGTTGTADATSPPDSGGGDAEPVGPAPIELRGTSARAIANGSAYAATVLDGIPPYSEGTIGIDIANIGQSAITIESVTLEPVSPSEAIEWELNEPGSTSRKPLTFKSVELAPKGTASVGVFFYPLVSGARDAKLTVRYDGGKSYVITINARGRDNATFSPNVSNALERIFGRSNVSAPNSAQPGGLTVDSSGTAYFSFNTTQWSDNYTKNVALARMAPDGSASWVREFHETYDQSTRDVGDNGEIGGAGNSLALDSAGNLFLAFQRSRDNANSVYQAAAINVKASDGSFVWGSALVSATKETPTIAKEGMRAWVVDASLPDRILLAGQVSDPSSGLYLAALKKSDGSLLWAKGITLSSPPRIGAITVSGTTAYIGGITGTQPIILRFDGVDGSAPTLAWGNKYTGASITRGLAVEGDGVIAALEVRGLSTGHVAARVKATDGSVVWAKSWVSVSGDNNNTLALAMHEGQAIVGGRVAIQPFDTQMGEGFLLSLNPTSGAYNWGSFYYTGKGAEEIVEGFVTGLASTSSGLWVVQQQTPGSNNKNHFWGRWYQATDATLALPGGDGSKILANASVASSSLGSSLIALPNVKAYAFTATGAAWVDQKSAVTVADPVQAEKDKFQGGTNILVQRVTVKK